MKKVLIDTKQIKDKETFHQVFAKTFGFFSGYGKNMDAWIDCMSCLSSEKEMVAYQVSSDEQLLIELTDSESFRKRLPEIFSDLIDCSATVNQRFIRDGIALRICIVPL